MKKKALIIIPVIALLCVVAAFAFTGKNTAGPASNETTSSSVSEQTNGPDESQISEILKNTAVISVYAPEGATVLLDGKEMPYSDAVKCHRIIDELSGSHTLKVTRDGYEAFTKEIDLDTQKNHEIKVELTALPSARQDALKKAEEILPEIVKVCNDSSGDLSAFSFYNEEEKSSVQDTVYGIIDGLSVDTENYRTGKIQLTNIIYDASSTAGDSISQETDSRGRLIKFTAEYSYTWEYNSDSYKDSGIDSSTAKGLILLDYINGEWCIRELYLPLRKSVH